MSGLNDCLETILTGLEMSGANDQLPALYADGIFPQLTCIVATIRRGGEYFECLSKKMASVCQCIDHIFSLHYNCKKNFR